MEINASVWCRPRRSIGKRPIQSSSTMSPPPSGHLGSLPLFSPNSLSPHPTSTENAKAKISRPALHTTQPPRAATCRRQQMHGWQDATETLPSSANYTVATSPPFAVHGASHSQIRPFCRPGAINLLPRRLRTYFNPLKDLEGCLGPDWEGMGFILAPVFW